MGGVTAKSLYFVEAMVAVQPGGRTQGLPGRTQQRYHEMGPTSLRWMLKYLWMRNSIYHLVDGKHPITHDGSMVLVYMLTFGVY